MVLDDLSGRDLGAEEQHYVYCSQSSASDDRQQPVFWHRSTFSKAGSWPGTSAAIDRNWHHVADPQPTDVNDAYGAIISDNPMSAESVLS